MPFLLSKIEMKKKKKYNYKNKELLYSKFIFGEMTLEDVLEVFLQPSYQSPGCVLVRLDDGEEILRHFRVVGDELHLFFNKEHPAVPMMRTSDYEWVENWPQPTLWFSLKSRVKVRGYDIELAPLKGTKKKKACLVFSCCGRQISVLERTQPNDS